MRTNLKRKRNKCFTSKLSISCPLCAYTKTLPHPGKAKYAAEHAHITVVMFTLSKYSVFTVHTLTPGRCCQSIRSRKRFQKIPFWWSKLWHRFGVEWKGQTGEKRFVLKFMRINVDGTLFILFSAKNGNKINFLHRQQIWHLLMQTVASKLWTMEDGEKTNDN